ncbi:polyprenol phosphomannose-dependent alpha 1,6 mannosyltransferase MptB [Granulicoccus sp. GXG6511]|uniref:polyprenol phosphomannose-dependent alpha 1,6 mannosyltransferase MptB n=1 Tax=Granulicoccus sp. GXG6511 TaxID=3381351 RepID=UPI003D7F06DA
MSDPSRGIAPPPTHGAVPSTAPDHHRHVRLWALLGFLGATLVALMAFGVGYLEDGPRQWLERHAAWTRESSGRYVARLSGLIGSLLMFVAWWRLRPSRRTRTEDGTEHAPGWGIPFRRIALLWTLPFWPVPALLTADAYAYAAQGWLLHQGLDPYVFAMGFPSPFAESVYPTWRPTTAVYPPLALHLQHLIVDLTGAHPYWAPVAMRLMALAGFGLMLAVAAPLARTVGAGEQSALWFVALNPLLLIQFIGGAHNDALMVGLIMLALWLARTRFGLVTGCIVIGLAAAVKQPAVFAGLGVVLFNVLGEHRTPGSPVPWGRLAGRLVLGGAIGAATFLAVSAPRGLWFGWLSENAGSPSLVINHSPLSWLAQGALALDAPVSVVDTVLTLTSTALMIAAFIWVAGRWALTRPVRFTAGLLLAFGLLGAAIQPWYILWGGPLLAFCHPTRRLVRIAGAITLMLLVSGVLQEYLSPAIVVPLGALIAAAWWRWGARVTGAAQHS